MLTVVVRRAEGVVGHAPARWEDDKVSDGHTWSGGLGGQNGEDGRILWDHIKKSVSVKGLLA